MFIGHFGVAYAAKRVERRPSLGVLFAAAQLPDLLWPLLLLIGWERAHVVSSPNPFLRLSFDSYPWTHSLAGTLGLALVAAGLYGALTRNRRGALVVGLLVLSHWVLDVASHIPDLQLAPGIPTRVGLGLWRSEAATIVIEGLLFGGGVWLYATATRARDRVGSWATWSLVAVLAGFYVANIVGPPPPSIRAVAWAGLGLWLFPPWAAWADRHRSPVGPNGTADGAAHPPGSGARS